MRNITIGRGGSKLTAPAEVWIIAILSALDDKSFSAVLNKAGQIQVERAGGKPNGSVWTP